MQLYIAEKPSVGKVIAQAVGGKQTNGKGFIECENGITITWCIGYLLEFCMPDDINPDYKYWKLEHLPMNLLSNLYNKPNPKTKQQLDCVVRLIKKANSIVHLGDPDSAGQDLVDRVIEYAGFKGQVLRGLIVDLNLSAIRKALLPQNLVDNRTMQGVSDSEYCRGIFDYYYGMNMSRLCSLLYSQKVPDSKLVLSVGRVQTVILCMIIRRELEHKNHKPVSFYPLSCTVQTSRGRTFGLKINLAEHFVSQYQECFDSQNRLINKELGNALAQQIIGAELQITSVVTEDKYSNPPLPFSLLQLQKMASQVYDYDPDETLAITQSLRENHALISYNRTDCGYLFESTHAEAQDIMATAGQVLPVMQNVTSYADFKIKSRAFNDKNVSAHYGIIPVINDRVANGKAVSLNEKETNIYMLICRNFIAQFFPKLHKSHTKISIDTDNMTFATSQSFVMNQGWKALFDGEKTVDTDQGEEDGEEATFSLSELQVGETVRIIDVKVKDSKTKPAALYTMDTLLQDLTRASVYIDDINLKSVLVEKDKDLKGESGGIGTPATRSDAIAASFKRKLAKKKGKSLIGTELGHDFFKALPLFAKQVDLTAFWQLQLNKVENGELTKADFQWMVQRFVDEKVNELKVVGLDIPVRTRNATAKTNTIYKCPKCSKDLRQIKKKGKKPFWSCTGYFDKTCAETFFDKRGAPDF